MKRGLPYGWWKSAAFWAPTVAVLLLAGLMTVLVAEWVRWL